MRHSAFAVAQNVLHPHSRPANPAGTNADPCYATSLPGLCSEPPKHTMIVIPAPEADGGMPIQQEETRNVISMKMLRGLEVVQTDDIAQTLNQTIRVQPFGASLSIRLHTHAARTIRPLNCDFDSDPQILGPLLRYNQRTRHAPCLASVLKAPAFPGRGFSLLDVRQPYWLTLLALDSD